MGLAIDGANRNDSKLVEATLTCLLAKRPAPTEEAPQNLCLDAGYDYDFVRDLVAEFGFTAHVRSRGEEAQAIKKEAGYRARRKQGIGQEGSRVSGASLGGGAHP